MKTTNLACALFALFVLVLGPLGMAAQPQMSVASQTALTGQLLVASQQLKDSNFTKTVIYVIAYSDEGAMGVIVNRVFGTISFRKLLAAFGMTTRASREVNVYLGGPVDMARGLVLHSPDYRGASTQQMGLTIALSTGPDVLQALAEGKGPKQSRIMLGYAGWGAGQLDHEMARGDWLVAPADPSLIFSSEPGEIWSTALKHAGISL